MKSPLSSLKFDSPPEFLPVYLRLRFVSSFYSSPLDM